MGKKYKIISLDIFQTLVDVNQRIPQIWEGILGEKSTKEQAYKGAEAVVACYTKAVQPCLVCQEAFKTMEQVYLECANLMIQMTGVKVEPEKIVHHLCLEHSRAPYFPEVKETLDWLKKHYRVILSSDANHIMADPIIQTVQPEYTFLSDDMQCYKGEMGGRFFSMVAKQLGVAPEEILHIGDSSHDVLGAKMAGVGAVWLNRTAHTWNHSMKPDYEISSLEDMTTIQGEMIR